MSNTRAEEHTSLLERHDSSLRDQLKRRITRRERAESLYRRTRRHWKVSLHLTLEIIQIGFQYLRFVPVRNRPQSKLLPGPSLFQGNFSRRLRIAHPLRPPSRSHQEPLASEFQQINRSRINPAALAPAHLQKIVVGIPKAKSNQESEYPVERALHTRRCTKFRQSRVHIGTPWGQPPRSSETHIQLAGLTGPALTDPDPHQEARDPQWRYWTRFRGSRGRSCSQRLCI